MGFLYKHAVFPWRRPRPPLSWNSDPELAPKTLLHACFLLSPEIHSCPDHLHKLPKDRPVGAGENRSSDSSEILALLEFLQYLIKLPISPIEAMRSLGHLEFQVSRLEVRGHVDGISACCLTDRADTAEGWKVASVPVRQALRNAATMPSRTRGPS